MKNSKFIKLFSIAAMSAAGLIAVGSGLSNKEVESVSAAESKSRIVLVLEDQCYATSDGRDPSLHIWSISVDSSMGFDSSNLKKDLKDANCINDFESGARGKQLNDDGSIDTGFSWSNQDGYRRYWIVKLPWYIKGFTYKINCQAGSGTAYWGSTERTVSSTGSYMTYTYGSWNSWDQSLGSKGSSGESNTYNVDKYTISTSVSGGKSGCIATVSGNGGSATTSGSYFKRQKIQLVATPDQNSEFVSWSDGKSTSSANNYDYVSGAKTYTATFNELAAPKHQVSYANGGATGQVPTQADVEENGTFTVASPTNLTYTNYTFSYWAGSDGKNYNPGDTFTMNTSDVTLTAVWTENAKYTVTFMDSDLEAVYDSVTVYVGTAATPKGTPSKDNEGGKQYTFSKWVDNNETDMTSSLANVQSNLTVYPSYTSAYRGGRYIVGVANDWSIQAAIYMTHVDNEYSANVTLAYGDEIKVVYYDGSAFKNDTYCGYTKITPNANAYKFFGKGTNSGDDDNKNIKCYAAGTYTFYFTDDHYDGSYKISCAYTGNITAQHLAAQLMGANIGSGKCTDDDKFPAMKALFLGMSSDEQNSFKAYESETEAQFKNAYDRYVAWALANGEKPWESGKVNSARLFSNGDVSTGSTLIIVIVSLVGVTSIGGYFFFRKRKENI